MCEGCLRIPVGHRWLYGEAVWVRSGLVHADQHDRCCRLAAGAKRLRAKQNSVSFRPRSSNKVSSSNRTQWTVIDRYRRSRRDRTIHRYCATCVCVYVCECVCMCLCKVFVCVFYCIFLCWKIHVRLWVVSVIFLPLHSISGLPSGAYMLWTENEEIISECAAPATWSHIHIHTQIHTYRDRLPATHATGLSVDWVLGSPFCAGFVHRP